MALKADLPSAADGFLMAADADPALLSGLVLTLPLAATAQAVLFVLL